MMNGHELKKRVNDFLGWLLLRPLYFFVPRLPLRTSYALARKAGLIVHGNLKTRRS